MGKFFVDSIVPFNHLVLLVLLADLPQPTFYYEQGGKENIFLARRSGSSESRATRFPSTI